MSEFSWPIGVVDLLLPPAIAEAGGLERARGRALVLCSTAVVAVGLVGAVAGSFKGDAISVAAGLLTVALFALIPLLYRATESARTAGLVYLAVGAVLGTVLLPILGGLHGPSVYWPIIWPAIAAVVVDFRASVAAGAYVALMVGALAAAHRMGWIPGGLDEGTAGAAARIVALSAALQVVAAWTRERALEEAWAEYDAQAAARSHLDAADLARATILARVSHELRTPMTGILGLSELLSDSELEPQQRDWVRTIRQTGTALRTLLDDLLDSARLDTGHLQLKPRPFRPADLAEQVLALFRHEANSHGLGLHLDVATGVPTKMEGDPARIRQILVNLVGNALKFTREGGVVLRVSQLAGVLVYEVTDTGKGIPADRLADVFEPFVRAEEGTSDAAGGVGLGLSIARKLVDVMGGEISVRSELGTGTTFEVKLPLEILDDDAPTTDTTLMPLKKGEKLRVLVAEDNEVNRMVLTSMVQSLGHEVHVVPNGLEVLPAARTFRPDVVLMDMRMPEVDGLEATRRLRDDPEFEALRVLALTANAYEEDRRACYAAGMDGFLAKPVSRLQLKAALEFGAVDAELGYTTRA